MTSGIMEIFDVLEKDVPEEEIQLTYELLGVGPPHPPMTEYVEKLVREYKEKKEKKEKEKEEEKKEK